MITDASADNGPHTSLKAAPGVESRRGGVAYGGLIWTLVRTDFKTRYHGSVGGFVWALLKPLAMFLMLMAVFSFVFASNPDYKLNLIIGLFLWECFAEGTKAGLASLDARGFLLTKARCPAWILVVTSISNATITLAVFVVIVLGFLLWSGRTMPIAGVLLFLAYCMALVVIVAGFSLAASGLFLRYRDLNQVWDMTLQAGFFLAPIVYPLSILPEPYHRYLYLWPPTPLIEFSRDVLVRGTSPSSTGHLLLSVAVVLTLAVGIAAHRLLTPRAADTSEDAVTVIDVDTVSKAFWIPTVKRNTVREHVLGMLRPRRFHRHQVLDRVSFSVRRGEAFGIMGRNGGGKSTLLKILSGVYQPDGGRVVRRAAITPILELGVGWNPELDAIDNVCLIGAVMGLTLPDVRRRMDRILEFAELEPFANLKLKHYSSGMAARLGYAVAFEAVQDVLVLDEIFAVGDAGFRAKCEHRYRELREAGHTVVLVSHTVPIVTQFCDRAALLEGGRVVAIGRPAEIAAAYLATVAAPSPSHRAS